ncbi:MAG: hypothetical protein QOI36_2311 [Pseudonocardiales bacterium]|jgi:hypothetical protein|nr:hypothetical protein [Pseudonocardiales bacterium]
MSITHPVVFPAEHLTREQRRAATAEHLLSALEALVRRHRALALDRDDVDLHAELISAEVAHELAITRSALQRHPQIPRRSDR